MPQFRKKEAYQDTTLPDGALSDLTLVADCEEIYDNEAFNLCEERDKIKHFRARVLEITNILKKKFSGKNVLVRQEPGGDAESPVYYECSWEKTFVKAVKLKIAVPSKHKTTFSITKGADPKK